MGVTFEKEAVEKIWDTALLTILKQNYNFEYEIQKVDI